MTADEIFAIAKKATIKTSDKGGGQGVVVGESLILTAAHCLPWTCGGEMADGLAVSGPKHLIINTPMGEIKSAILAVEPVSDIAVLGPLDLQDCRSEEDAKEADKFEFFMRSVKPIPIQRTLPKRQRI